MIVKSQLVVYFYHSVSHLYDSPQLVMIKLVLILEQTLLAMVTLTCHPLTHPILLSIDKIT